MAKNPKYVNLKINELGKAIRMSLGVDEPEMYVGEKVMDQFVSEFDKVSTENQYRIMTSMPRDVNRDFLQQTFGVTEHKARRAKEIQGEYGLLSTPNPKPGKRIPEVTDKLIKQFYESDHISRQMSGRKDCISMMVNGKKEKVQKRQILCTVYEAYL